MQNKPLVSVIVPVYNAEKYLDRCISSLVSQTYSNLEIVLINDGSTDSSGEICNEYANKDLRIKVIHQRNKGAAEAKNKGLDAFTGDYVSFIDSDDYVKETYIEKLLKLSIEFEAEIVQCLYEIGSSNHFKSIVNQKFEKILFDDNQIFYSKYYKSIVWGKLYKKELFVDIRFTPKRHIDDEGVSYKSYYLATRTLITTEHLYYYYQSPNSLMRNDRTISLDFMDTFEERLHYFKERKEMQLLESSMEKYCIVLMLKYMSVINNPLNSKTDAKKILDRFNEIFLVVIKSKHRNFKYIIILSIFRLFPRFSSGIRNLRKKRR